MLLDVWRRKDLPSEPAPVLLFVPGGAWVHGSRLLQGYALMSHLAEMGWVCLSIDYRVAPHHRWPAHITDVKTAIAWARANVDKFGGDRNFVAVAGTSAGGHLAALAGLTVNDPEMQGDLPEGSDTSFQMCMELPVSPWSPASAGTWRPGGTCGVLRTCPSRQSASCC